jgi:toxin FitB
MIILDTNVVSEIMKPSPSPDLRAWVRKQLVAELYTTAITEAEIFFGIEVLPHGKRRAGLMAVAEAIFAKDFAGRIFGFDTGAARLFAKITSHRRVLGRPMSQADGQIAAIAKLQGAKLATRDVADFSDCGIDLINPWE